MIKSTARGFESLIKRNSRTAKGLTGLFALLLAICAFFWVVTQTMTPPQPEEEQYVTMGSIDFGNNTEGSKDINNFEDPKPNPSETSKAEATETETKAVSEPVVENVLSTDEPEEVKAPPVVKKPAKVTPKPTPVEPKPEKPRKRAETFSSDGNSSNGGSGGSNHGDNKNGTGNRGTPNTTVLDPDGRFEFGPGGDGEGIGNRELLSKVIPKYDAQEEGKMTFLITISAAGRVVDVKTVRSAGQTRLKQNTEDALKKMEVLCIVQTEATKGKNHL